MGRQKVTVHRPGPRARTVGILAAAAVAAVVTPWGGVAEAGRSKCFGRRPTIVVNTRGHSRVVGTKGPDVILVRRGWASIRSKNGDDLICGGRRGDRIRAGAGDDRVTARGGADSVGGGRGFDRISGGTGNDSLSGGRSTDHVRGNAGGDTIRLGGGQLESPDGQLARGGSGDDEIYGGEDHERIYGGSGNDRIFGYEGTTADLVGGDDYLYGQSGSDQIVSGKAPDEARGPDTHSFGGSGDDVLEDLDGGATLAGGPGDDELKAAEGHCCTALDYSEAPSVHLDLAAGVATGDGNDTITGDVGRVVGSASDDILMGDDGDTSFSGGAGNDDIEAGGGEDGIAGGPGDDLLDGGAGEDWLRFGETEDGAVTVDLGQGTSVGDGADRLVRLENVSLTGKGNDVIIGDEDPNKIEWSGSGLFKGTLEGRGGDDAIRLVGNGSISAGAGDDAVTLFHMHDARVTAGEGSDVISVVYLARPERPIALDGGRGDDMLSFKHIGGAPVEADLAAGTAHLIGEESVRYDLTAIEGLVGTQWNDVLLGDDGPNTLVAFDRNDRIEGRGGDDHLDGGDDVDTLDGGDGSDTCVNGESVSGCEG